MSYCIMPISSSRASVVSRPTSCMSKQSGLTTFVTSTVMCFFDTGSVGRRTIVEPIPTASSGKSWCQSQHTHKRNNWNYAPAWWWPLGKARQHKHTVRVLRKNTVKWSENLVKRSISVKTFQFIYLLETTLRKLHKPDLLGPSQNIVR